jgi:hypothetical protein
MSDHSPFIAVELILVFGGALAIAWWQLRDVKRAQEETRRRREEAEAAARTEEDVPPADSDAPRV